MENRRNGTFIYHYLPSILICKYVAAYAEAVYDSVVSRYRVTFLEKFILHGKSLYANCMANPIEKTCIYLSPTGFKVRSSHHCLTDVIPRIFAPGEQRERK
jgi:hypothetical protein